MGVFLNSSRKKKNIQSSNTVNKNNFKNYVVRAVSLIKGQSDNRESLTAPEYNLAEIREASEADSYIKMAVSKYSYMMFKAGYKLKSENEEAKEYIKTRLYIMSFSTGIPTDILFQELGDDLIKYSNAFLIKSRVDNVMAGVNAKGFFKDKPVGGYFRIDPTTLIIQRDKFGTIKKYVQIVDGEEKQFAPEDVIHFYLDKEAKNAFGTPRILPALEDVKMLRNIEGNVLTLIHRFSMPLFHWKIGLPQTGFQASKPEIDEARAKIENMALDGSIVTNEKTEIKSVGAEGTALNAKEYLNYFESRVFTALGVTQSQMGRGSSGSTEDVESQAHNTIRYIQRIFAIFMQNMVFNELLFEGGFNPITKTQDRVEMIFNEISLDTMIKLENHEMNKFQSNMITFDEMRHEIDMPENVDENKLYQNMIINKSEEYLSNIKNEQAKELADAQGDVNIRVAKATTSCNDSSNSESGSKSFSSNYIGKGTKGNNAKGNGKNKSAKPNGTIANINTPENQYGKISVKIKESLEFNEKLTKSKKNHKKVFSDIYIKYNLLRNDITENIQDKDVLIQLSYQEIVEQIKTYVQLYSMQGIKKATSDISDIKNKQLLLPELQLNYKDINEEIRIKVKKLLNDINKKITDDMSANEIKAVFDTLEYRLRFLIDFVLPKAYWYSYVMTGPAFGIKKAYIDFGMSDDAKDHKSIIDIEKLDINQIPPFHAYCSCKITFTRKGEK